MLNCSASILTLKLNVDIECGCADRDSICRNINNGNLNQIAIGICALLPSSALRCVTDLWLVVQDGSYQAQSNLKFLSILKDPCHELADAQPKDIPPMLPKILSLIRMIWVNSEFYNTKERLTGILRKVRH